MTSEYEELANAIIERAAIDYRAALKRLKPVPKKERQDILEKLLKEEKKKKRKQGRTPLERAVWTKHECEEFFGSEWFCVLTSLDGKMLLIKLQKEGI